MTHPMDPRDTPPDEIMHRHRNALPLFSLDGAERPEHRCALPPLSNHDRDRRFGAYSAIVALLLAIALMTMLWGGAPASPRTDAPASRSTTGGAK